LLFNFVENLNFVETFLFFWIIFSPDERIINSITIFFIYITESEHFTLSVVLYVVKEGAIYIALNFHVNPYPKSKILVEELTEYRY